MKRREFITLLGGSAAAWPLAARAQQPVMPVIGFVVGGGAAELARAVAAFRAGLNEAGFVEGRNVAIEFRWAEGQYQRLPAMAAELVGRHVAVILAGTGASALAAKGATTTIPIVFVMGSDPVKIGAVSSLSRPGGNITGAFMLSTALEAKRLELLHEVVPAAGMVGLLVNPTFPDAESQVRDVQAAAQTMAIGIVAIRASSAGDIDGAFSELVERRGGALLVASDPFLFAHRNRIITLAARHRLPAIYQWRDFAEDGGLMSYGTNLAEPYRLAGTYTGRILKGEKPAELPVVQSTKVEFAINLKTAKTLGLTIPLPLLGRADEVIE